MTTLQDARGETRTRKTRRSGDFESPASTNSTTRAVHGNVLPRRHFLNASGSARGPCSMLWWCVGESIASRSVLSRHLLDPAANLLLQGRIPRALQWRHELREIALLP